MFRRSKRSNHHCIHNIWIIGVVAIILSACAAVRITEPVPLPGPSQALINTPSLSSTLVITTSPTLEHTSTPIPVGAQIDEITGDGTATTSAAPSSTATVLSTSSPDEWMSLPVIPSTSQTAWSIFERGLAMGNDAHSFSKIGDCQSISTYFLARFDKPGLYNLGVYSDLQDTIDWYSGSFSRDSLAVKGGYNAAAILSPLRADPRYCQADENPIVCEIRLHRPSIAIISLEEWWAGHPENYEKYMRQILEYTISQGVVPILATKADNLEGNNLINQTIARLAKEYDIPLWNFWAAVQPLPNHGLEKYNPMGEVDMFHITHSVGYFDFDLPSAEQSGWSVRNLTALQTLDAVRRGLMDQP